eukprot:5968138-Amphidinium_carterae.1
MRIYCIIYLPDNPTVFRGVAYSTGRLLAICSGHSTWHLGEVFYYAQGRRGVSIKRLTGFFKSTVIDSFLYGHDAQTHGLVVDQCADVYSYPIPVQELNAETKGNIKDEDEVEISLVAGEVRIENHSM